jgi:hypothetical protein
MHLFLVVISYSRLLVIVPGLGEPLINRKVESLQRNMQLIPSTAEYLIFYYSPLPSDLLANLPRKVTLVYNNEGFAHRFLDYATSDYVKNGGFSHILIILDDITLHSWIPLKHIEPTDYEIFSPVLSKSNMTLWQYMIHDDQTSPNQVYTNDFLELFAYYMTVNAFCQYWKFFSKISPWTWGMDLIIRSHMDLHPVLINDWKMDHWKPGTTTPRIYDSWDPCNDYLKLYGTSFEECRERDLMRRSYDIYNLNYRQHKPSYCDEYECINTVVVVLNEDLIDESEYDLDELLPGNSINIKAKKKGAITDKFATIFGCAIGILFMLAVIRAVIYFKRLQ